MAMSNKIIYTKAMIELVYGIRKRVPPDFKPSVKMANPGLFKELMLFHRNSEDTITKALIKELIFLCGEPWVSLLSKESVEQNTPKLIAKVYRGQASLSTTAEKSHKHETEKPKRKMVYRGQVVYG